MTDNTANEHLPLDVVPMDAFNLIPGAAFMLIDQPDPRVWVVEKVARDQNFESVSVWAHDVTEADHLPRESAFVLGYCVKVALVGIVVNPHDDSDNNWGAS
jgi:hypothetical protein